MTFIKFMFLILLVVPLGILMIFFLLKLMNEFSGIIKNNLKTDSVTGQERNKRPERNSKRRGSSNNKKRSNIYRNKNGL